MSHSGLPGQPALNVPGEVFVHGLDAVGMHADGIPLAAQRRGGWPRLLLRVIAVLAEQFGSFVHEGQFSQPQVIGIASLLRGVLLERVHLHE